MRRLISANFSNSLLIKGQRRSTSRCPFLVHSGSPSQESGVALVLVMFIVAIASILVVNLAYDSSLESRSNLMVEQSLQAEYLLKSAISIARAVIAEDDSAEDGPNDIWANFLEGVPLPLDLLGVEQPGFRLSLEIRPEESKFPLRAVIAGGNANVRWRDAMVRLLRELGFDDDEEPDHTGFFGQRVFRSDEMVANLIDFMTPGDQSYRSDDFVSGVKDQLPDGYFPGRTIRRVGELSSIPGFTPTRMRSLTPFVTSFGSSRRLNINLAPALVLRSLHLQIEESESQAIVQFRQSAEGPFSSENQKLRLSEIIGEAVYDEIAPMIGVRSSWFQVLAKVESGASLYFMRAYVSKAQPGQMPAIRLVEFY